MGKVSKDDIIDMFFPYVVEKYNELSDEMNKQSISFWQNLLLVSSSLIGVLASLYDNTQRNLDVQIAFLLSIALLTLCSLFCGIILYAHSIQPKRMRQALLREFEKSLRQGAPMEEVIPKPDRWLALVQKITLVLLMLSVFSILAYSFLKVLMI